MNTAAAEWAERVAARNAIETAKARGPQYIQGEFLWNEDASAELSRASQPTSRSTRRRRSWCGVKPAT